MKKIMRNWRKKLLNLKLGCVLIILMKNIEKQWVIGILGSEYNHVVSLKLSCFSIISSYFFHMRELNTTILRSAKKREVGGLVKSIAYQEVKMLHDLQAKDLRRCSFFS